MNLNHINLPVDDVNASRDFFAKYFGMRTMHEIGKNALVIMRDEGGLVLNLSHFDRKTEIHYHKDFHIGFFVETRAEVDGLYARMVADGLDAGTPKEMHGRWTFYVASPGGFETEVACVLEGASWVN
jgi:catechol 2,3-dioxygenase-like lactoylglutathione lyase family enzyme